MQPVAGAGLGGEVTLASPADAGAFVSGEAEAVVVAGPCASVAHIPEDTSPYLLPDEKALQLALFATYYQSRPVVLDGRGRTGLSAVRT